LETISSIVKKIIETKPFIHESMARGIISFGNLADILLPEIEKFYDGDVKNSAVVMALRRYGSELKKKENEFNITEINYEITIKTNILDINIVKRAALLNNLTKLYQLVALERGDFLNITIGSNEVGIAVSQKYSDQLNNLLSGETILHRKTDLVALTVIFSGDFLYTPGVIYEAVRKLTWEHINVLEIVSTMNELTFVINRSDSAKAYEALQVFI
jgi:aspartokinase